MLTWMYVLCMGVPKWILLSIELLILGGFAVQVMWLQQSEVQRQQPTTNRTKLYKKANYVATLNATVQHGT